MNNTNSTNYSNFELSQPSTFALVRIIYLGLVIVIGFVVNGFYICTSIARCSRLSSAAQYLFGIAAADFCALFILLLTWIYKAFGLELYNDWTCKVFTFVGSVGCSLSPVLITSLTLERFVVVMFPLHGQRILSKDLTRVIVSFIFLAGALFNTWVFFAVKAFKLRNAAECGVTDEHYYVVLKIDTVNTMMVFSAPIALIFASNLLIVFKLMRRQNVQEQKSRSRIDSHMSVQGLKRHDRLYREKRGQQNMEDEEELRSQIPVPAPKKFFSVFGHKFESSICQIQSENEE